MKTIYNAVVNRLNPFLKDNTLGWIDWDKGQLKKLGSEQKPPVKFPCALIRIGITSTQDLTDTLQNCKARVTVTLAFDAIMTNRSSGNATEEVRAKFLEPYDIIAAVYARLQGFCEDFNPLHRISQSEVSHDRLFVYQIVFETEFEDDTAEE